MSLRLFLRGKNITLCFFGIGACLLAVALESAGVENSLIWMFEGFLLLFILLWLTISFLVMRKRVQKLYTLCDSLEDKYLIGEILERPESELELPYYWAMMRISKSAIEQIETTKREKEEYGEFVESWIHELKTPLTACSLILANDGDLTKMRRELKRADNLLETILYYARLRTVEKDTVIRRCSLAKIANEAVQSEMVLLIAAGISVSVEGDKETEVDDNALLFCLKQLLVNSAKYCQGCKVGIRIEGRTIVYEDNGIGIRAEERKRVFERGYTGTNGRAFGGNTGMGLYLVGELCAHLGITLLLESETKQENGNGFTRFTFRLPGENE